MIHNTPDSCRRGRLHSVLGAAHDIGSADHRGQRLPDCGQEREDVRLQQLPDIEHAVSIVPLTLLALVTTTQSLKFPFTVLLPSVPSTSLIQPADAAYLSLSVHVHIYAERGSS